MAPYPTDNPIDGIGRPVGGEVEAGRAAMPAHTPGPWRVAGPSGSRYRVEDERVGCLVALSRLFTNDNDAREAHANARLIAAAPQLLAALIVADAFMAGFEQMDGGDNIDAQIAQVRAAIAAAEGR